MAANKQIYLLFNYPTVLTDESIFKQLKDFSDINVALPFSKSFKKIEVLFKQRNEGIEFFQQDEDSIAFFYYLYFVNKELVKANKQLVKAVSSKNKTQSSFKTLNARISYAETKF